MTAKNPKTKQNKKNRSFQPSDDRIKDLQNWPSDLSVIENYCNLSFSIRMLMLYVYMYAVFCAKIIMILFLFFYLLFV